MLYITYKREGYGYDYHTWHIDTKLPEGMKEKLSDSANAEDLSNLVSVYADGDELEWIENNFRNMPVGKGRSTTYFGDMAKMIVAALPELP